ncbi:MAG: hypothetical protein ACLP8S_03075 [Solirubrobacteraceae bacterium]
MASDSSDNGSDTDTDGDSDDDSSAVNSAAESSDCPPLANDPPPDLVVVCVPVYLAGSFSSTYPILIIPGGAILGAPIGASLTAPTAPTLTSTKAILAWGTAIEGANLTMSAPTIELAGRSRTRTWCNVHWCPSGRSRAPGPRRPLGSLALQSPERSQPPPLAPASSARSSCR